MKKNKVSVVVVDDHELLRNGLANLINNFDQYSLLFEAGNGKDFIKQLKAGEQPDIVMLDINMPEMDGYDTALWLKKNCPSIKVLALSMYDTENAIIRMLKSGAKGYIFKNSTQKELKKALDSLVQQGHYFSELVSSKLVHALNNLGEPEDTVSKIIGLNDREIEFIKLACTDLSYPEIAKKMFVSPRTIENYRDALYEKFEIKSRVGLVMYAIRNNIVSI